MYEKNNVIIGSVLKHYRKSKDITLESAASKLSKSKGWLGDIESGRNKIYFEDVIKLCRIYDVDIDEVAKMIRQESASFN